MRTRAHVMVTASVLGSVLALSACAAPPPMPPALTDEEVREIIAVQNADWWRGMFPTEPMPEVQPIAEVAEADRPRIVAECSRAALPPGVVAQERASDSSGGATARDRAYFICSLQYPLEVVDPTRWGLYSEAQYTWLYDYYDTRLIPCLRLNGFLVGALPARDDFVDRVVGHWSPYFAMSPQPDTAAEWERIDLRCPPPALGDPYRPGAQPG